MLLEIQNLSKSFGSLRAADSIDFSVARGEALGIIGPNGAGKSTLFNLITGDLKPNSGRVRFHRADAFRALPPRHRPLVSDPASVREFDRIRESAGWRDLCAGPARAPDRRFLRRGAGAHELDAARECACRFAHALGAQAARARARPRYRADAAVARRDRRRAYRGRMPGIDRY